MFDAILERVDLTKISPRMLIGLPLVVLLVCILIIGIPFLIPGYSGPFKLRMGMDLQGGTVAVISGVDVDPALQRELQDYFNTPQINLREMPLGTSVEAPADVDTVELEKFIRERYPNAEISSSFIGPTMGEDLQRQARNALILAFIGMTVVVFIEIRALLPSFTIIFSTISNMIIALGIMILLGVPLDVGTIGALLMVIGYSDDSHILLTVRVLKRKGSLQEKLRNTLGTGLTMSMTTIVAVFALWIVSTHPVLDSIAVVLVFALVADLMNTWMLNAGVLVWYLKRRGKA